MKAILIACTVFLSLTMFGQDSTKRAGLFNLSNGIGLTGFDPVSYFDGKPVKGKPTFKHKHEGVTYFFSTPGNKSLFIKSPSKYEPKYGGWCAYAMGDSGKKVEVDPETYKIINGGLYLFYNKFGNNTLEDWNKKEAVLKEKADKNWKSLTEK